MIYVEKSAQNTSLAELAAKEHNIEVIDDGFDIEDKKSNIMPYR